MGTQRRSHNIPKDPTTCKFTANYLGRASNMAGEAALLCVLCRATVANTTSIEKKSGKTNPPTGKSGEVSPLLKF